jgi:hypothetical protein
LEIFHHHLQVYFHSSTSFAEPVINTSDSLSMMQHARSTIYLHSMYLF